MWLPTILRIVWLGLAVTALARPQTAERRPAAAGRLLAVALDVSGSMGARDDQPTTRLQRAQALASAAAEQWRGGEFALITFAASARVRCLPTDDPAAFRRAAASAALDEDDNRTDLGAGLARALELLAERPGSVLLLTDGAQRLPDGLNPLEQARAAQSLGVPIHAVGIGDFSGPYAADAANLRLLSALSGGECAFGALPELGAATESANVVPEDAWRERWPWFVRAALVAMAAEWLLRRTWLKVRPNAG